MREIVRALENKLSYVKVKLILEILEESGLISIERSPECEDNLKITVNFVRGKADLEGSPTCMRIRSRMEKPSGV